MFKNNFLLKGFGFASVADVISTVLEFPLTSKGIAKVGIITAMLGSLRYFVKSSMGLDMGVFVAFVLLIGAEFQTGIKVARVKRGERFQSRKFGRMLLKICVYVYLIAILNAMAKGIDCFKVLGFEINPFLWLYYTVFMGIVFQMLISWLENLGALGYKESKTIAGIILRKFNKWFEFDGTKNNNE